MSDIHVIMHCLKPWTGRGQSVRFYDDLWMSRISGDLDAYQKAHPECRVMDLARYGKVWYDSDARAHADGIADPDLALFIARTMESTQFLPPFTEPEHGFQAYDWTKLSEPVPRDIFNYGDPAEPRWATVFHYKGRDFFVDHEYLTEQMQSNSVAYRNMRTGTICFECGASDLWELVLELVNDRIEEDRQRKEESGMFETAGTGIAESNGSVVRKSDSAIPRTENRDVPPENVPNIVLGRISDEEPNEIGIEQIKEETRPRSRWSKADILENCSKVGVPEKSIEVLRRMTLKDILESFLVYEGTDITGNEYDSMRQRHTRFYRLDFEQIGSLKSP